MVLMVLMAAFAIALSFAKMDAAALFRNCALVQAFPVVTSVALATVQNHRLDLSYARYGAFFAWFTLMALTTSASGRRRTSPVAIL